MERPERRTAGRPRVGHLGAAGCGAPGGAAWSAARQAAAAATALIGLNVIEVWFARYPTTEVVMQALTFAAMLAFTRNAGMGPH